MQSTTSLIDTLRATFGKATCRGIVPASNGLLLRLLRAFHKARSAETWQGMTNLCKQYKIASLVEKGMPLLFAEEHEVAEALMNQLAD